MSDQNANVEEKDVEQGVHSFSSEDKWVKPEDPALLEQIEWFKDQKLGFMMHWGPYSQLGLVESWALSDHDADWSREDVDWESDPEVFKQQYFDLNKSFNPIRFQPDEWAELAQEGGFKYFLFTTKHHDGFCMWDTKTTDYKVTDPSCPFHTHKNADIVKHAFDAFRAKGLPIAAYFSKADWHTPTYWAPNMERGSHMWRGPSYDPEKHPELWEEFVKFTHEQMMELLTDYGRIEVLWLDAGWVSPRSKQDIRLGELVEKAREQQPWLLSADRLIGGPYENIITPEQAVPAKPMDVPWESCITMGSAFSFRYEDDYKPTRELIHLLIEVISKGGNLALNVAAQPDGRLPRGAVERMKEMGAWLNVHGEAVYGTRMCAPHYLGNIAFTRKEDTVYCFYMYDAEDSDVRRNISIPYPEKVNRVDIVGGPEDLPFTQTDEGIQLSLPDSELSLLAPIAHVFRLR
ncbi:alpha-L-fucosidase [Bacillaceae bacterium SIJ1]|uniref:alpha-L-fucosidase n=1 Tax=Litoribacterium kuwaitense TaxID=1398745 RepID=UPI0013ED5710|nr:alpha-L-fucosidase [Litoribacterium kuwaitense]NGP46288.1 alpha-L-fucosidase [Litoribacterium kuwaitense]